MMLTFCRAVIGRSGCAMFGVAALAFGPGAALAQNELKTLAAFEFDGLRAIAPSEKDAGLVRAMSLIPARLKSMKGAPELPAELRQVPDELIDLAWARLGGPVRGVVTTRGTDPDTGFPLIGVVLSFGMADEEEARSMHAQLNGLRMQAGAGVEVEPSARFDGMLDARLPFGVVTFGPRESDEGWRYEMLFGAIPHPDRAFNGMPSLSAGSTVLSATIDLAAISPYVQPFVSMAMMGAPNGMDTMRQLREQGIFGPEAMSIEYMAGYQDDRAIERTVLRGVKDNADALGLATSPLTNADLAAAPADAIFAHVYQGAPRDMAEGVLQQMRPMLPQVDRFLQGFEQQTGVNLMDDVLGSFGGAGAVYMAHSTGGISLAAVTMVHRVDDAKRLTESVKSLADLGNAIAAQNIPTSLVGLTAAQFERHGAKFTQLQLRGLPAPIQPTFAVSGEWFTTSVTPQGCVAAVRQLARREGGLRGHDGFSREYARAAKGVSPVSVTFWDVSETIDDGYAIMLMAATALETTVRSPDGELDPGMVMPTLGDLRRSAAPFMRLSYWKGDDFVMDQSSDASLLVNGAAAFGFADLGPMIGGALVGAGVTAGIMENMDGFDRGGFVPAPDRADEPAF